MKHKCLFKRLLFAFAAFMLCSFSWAYRYYGNIYYDLDYDKYTATVTYASDSYNSYKGDVVIPEKIEVYDTQYTVTAIGASAFRDCEELKSVEIPNTVKSIGHYAFEGCSSLTSVDIPKGVTSIGVSAFRDCSSLASVNIPEGVTSIGTSAFYGCSSLASVTIPKGVTIINGFVFYGCSSLASVNIPEGVTSIDNYAFEGCSSLASVNIPEGVTSIGRNAFRDCSSLASVNISEGVTSIGSSAFYGCSSLISVTIPKGVTSIGQYAFYKCSSLTSVDIPEGVTSIETSTFNGCSRLTSVTIPKGVTSIGQYAFYGCSSLISVTIPKGVTSIGSSAFYKCSSLTSVDILEGVTSIEIFTFEGCSSLAYVTIPSSVTSIDSRAFEDCGIIEKVVINSDALLNNSSESFRLQGILSPSELVIGDDVKGIGGSVFSGCSSIKSVTIGKGVTSIGDYAFGSCYYLRSVIIGDGVTSIGSNAFYYCDSLRSVTFGKSVTSIGSGAFKSCNRVNEIYYSSVESMCNIAYENIDSNPAKHGSSSTSPDIKFYINGELATSVTIPSSVTSIGNYAFLNSGITSVTIPSRVTSIGQSAFYNCPITSVTIPSSVQSIGTDAFNNLKKLEINSDAVVNKKYGENEGLRYIFGNNVEECIIGSGVKGIGEKAFEIMPLKSVTIPSSVTSIGEIAFQGCSSLTSVDIPEGVTSIGVGAFSRCLSLASVTIPSSVTSIGNYAFYSCSSLTSISIPDGVTSIGDHVFEGSGLTSVDIPEGVTSIGDYAFNNCHSLASVTIPSSVTSIGNYAFSNCSSLTSISTDCVTSIGNYAFSNCSSLTSISTDGVTNIGDYAFYECTNLTSAKFPKEITGGTYLKPSKIIVEETFSGTKGGNSATSGDNGPLTTVWDCSESKTIASVDAVYEAGGAIKLGTASKAGSLTTVPLEISAGDIITVEIDVKGWTTYEGDLLVELTGCTQQKLSYSALINDSYETVTAVFENIPTSNPALTISTSSKRCFIDNIRIMTNASVIGGHAFFGCSSLTSVDIPEGVTSIGDYAFYGCSSLASVNIPEGVTSIGQSAFYGCPITSVTIPSSVTSIGGSFNSSNLTSMICLAEDVPTMPSSISVYIMFANIYVPASALEAYKAAEGWNLFQNIFPIEGGITVSVGSEGLATYCPPVGVDFSNATNIAAYRAAVDGSTVTLTRTDKVNAGEGVLLRSLEGGAVEENLPLSLYAENAENAFVGVSRRTTTLYETDEDGNTNFVLSNVNGVVDFYKAKPEAQGGTVVDAGKAYLPVPDYDSSADTKGLTLVFEDGFATGIDIVDSVQEQASDDDTYYTLGGVPVKNPTQKGIYIKGGKKYIIK